MSNNHPFMRFMVTISLVEFFIAFLLCNFAAFKEQLTSENVLFMIGLGFFVGGMFTFIIGIVVGQFMKEEREFLKN